MPVVVFKAQANAQHIPTYIRRCANDVEMEMKNALVKRLVWRATCLASVFAKCKSHFIRLIKTLVTRRIGPNFDVIPFVQGNVIPSPGL
jgi:hypothetical protein